MVLSGSSVSNLDHGGQEFRSFKTGFPIVFLVYPQKRKMSCTDGTWYGILTSMQCKRGKGREGKWERQGVKNGGIF